MCATSDNDLALLVFLWPKQSGYEPEVANVAQISKWVFFGSRAELQATCNLDDTAQTAQN